MWMLVFHFSGYSRGVGETCRCVSGWWWVEGCMGREEERERDGRGGNVRDEDGRGRSQSLRGKGEERDEEGGNRRGD